MRKERKDKTPPQPAPEDAKALMELRNAIIQCSELPPLAQWDTTLQLLSDEFLQNFVNARKRKKEDERMTMYGPLAMILVQYYDSQNSRNAEALMGALIGLTYSIYGELERRNQHFSTDVVFMENPVYFDPEDPVTFIPKDPDSFVVEEVFAYYNEKNSE